jgi:hypothetical protein
MRQVADAADQREEIIGNDSYSNNTPLKRARPERL